jgi:autotransporter-associated beta strand protein
VQEGGSLTIETGDLGAGTVGKGTGVGDSAAKDGAAYGGGVFLQGNQSLTLAPGSGQTLTISGVIADMTGSKDASGQTGAGSLRVSGAGTVALDADNTFTGGVTLTQGVLDLEADGAGGASAGIWDQSGGTLSVSSGDKMNFTGVGNVFSGTLAGAGTITFAGGSDTLSGATMTAPDGVFISGATMALVGAITVTDTLVAATPKIVVGAAGATLEGGGRLELTNASTNVVLGVSASATLSNDDVIFGAGDLGDGQMTLDNAAKGIIEGDDSATLTINTGTKTIISAGEIIAVTALTIDSPLDNTDLLLADGGTLSANGAITGAGQAEVDGAGTLILKGAFNENVTFASSSTGVLELGDSKGYTTGAISGFSTTGTNSLDLLDIPFVSGTTTATYSGTTTSGVLTVKDGANVATIHLTGNYTTSTFAVSASSAGGTKVVDPAQPSAPPHVAAPLSPHPFIAAMAGFGAREAGAAALDGVHWSMPPLMLAPSRALA